MKGTVQKRGVRRARAYSSCAGVSREFNITMIHQEHSDGTTIL